MTQEELIPYLLEEKKRQEEERAKQRELDEEMRQKAREDSQKLEEETRRIAEQRKVTFAEERRKLEHQTLLPQEGQERKKAPLSRSEAGRIIELELEEQRVREELTRIEIEKIKEKERAEQEKQKFKHAKKEEHPSTFQNKDLIQTPIFDETGDNVDGGDFQGVRLSTKRGSVIDLSESDGNSEQTKRPVGNRPAPEPVYTPPQPQPQAQLQQQPVIRRQKVNRNPEQRKSIVELEIERQKEREEEVRREAEIARKIQAKQQGADKGNEKRSEEYKLKEHHPRHASERNGAAVKPPSVLKKTEKFEKKHEGFKTKEHRPKLSESSGVAGKKSEVQKQVELETVVQQKTTTTVASTPAGDEVDAMQRMENGVESQGKEFETEEERKKREEKELFRQMQEEERRRREAQKEDLERIRKEVDRKEAEELMRLKLEKEEERRKQRVADRRLAEEREKDYEEKQKKVLHEAGVRKTAFATHKLILEQRVLKALEDSKQESTLPRRRASSFDGPTDISGQDESVSSETSEEIGSGGVKLRKATFEKTGARKDSKEEMRKKRYSLHVESARRGNLLEHSSLGSKHPGSVKERPPSYAADDVFIKVSQAQEDVATRRKASSNERKISKTKSLGDLSLKKGGQSDDLSAHPVFRKVSSNHDQTDSVDGFPSFSDSRIQKELEEQRMREEIVKQEVTEREKRHRLEEEKKKTNEQTVGKKEMSLNDIKRNPLPNKIQVITNK